MTADEFRLQQVGSVETIEINRPLRDVAATFRDRAPACIQDVQTTSINGPANRRLMTRWLYHETVVATDKNVELIVQATTPGAQMYELPEHGIYVLIVRTIPLDGRRSSLEIYGSWGSLWEESTLKVAVRGWAAGTFAGWSGTAMMPCRRSIVRMGLHHGLPLRRALLAALLPWLGACSTIVLYNEPGAPNLHFRATSNGKFLTFTAIYLDIHRVTADCRAEFVGSHNVWAPLAQTTAPVHLPEGRLSLLEFKFHTHGNIGPGRATRRCCAHGLAIPTRPPSTTTPGFMMWKSARSSRTAGRAARSNTGRCRPAIAPEGEGIETTRALARQYVRDAVYAFGRDTEVGAAHPDAVRQGDRGHGRRGPSPRCENRKAGPDR